MIVTELIKKEEKMKLYIQPIKHVTPVHLSLLLEADPDKKVINTYIYRAFSFECLYNNKIVGVLVLDTQKNDIMEILNISVHPDYQNIGIGSFLLTFANSFAKEKHCTSLEVCTGSTSIWQLYFYQKHGFRITKINTDYFIKTYDEPIFEHGIQLKDQLCLRKIL